jgi:class 3 adenylate cyclase/tetratricopeptide (TPR) repeat protein
VEPAQSAGDAAPTSELEQLGRAIEQLEAQRSLLGDAIIDNALAPLKARLAALTPRPTTGDAPQLKQVTVLFTDVVGSTLLSQQLDPEDVLAVMDGALRRFAAIIDAHGGRVLQFAGDGLHAEFGTITSREDDPERAVRAGLALLADADRHAAEIAARFGIREFAIRVGINTGQLLLGAGVDAERSAIGFAINVARRMEESAPPGGLRISHDTYRHVRGVFDVVEDAPLKVKGVDAPLRTYIVARAKPRAFRLTARGIEGVETPMVGRQRELAQLGDHLDAVIEDRELALVTVVGDAGLGKSRLLYEFDNALELRPERIWLFRGRAYPQTERQPYGLIRDLFAWRFEIQDDDPIERARQKLHAGLAAAFGTNADEPTALLGHLLGFDYASSPHVAGIVQDGRQIRDRAFHVATQYFRRLCESGDSAIAILLDDIHWADDGSLDFVNHLVNVAHDAPILIAGFARPALYERRPRWGSGQAAHARIDVAPLSKRGCRELADVLLQRVGNAPAELRELLTRGAEGNPFYMEELAKMLIDDGVIVVQPGRWDVELDRLAAVHVPPTLTGVLQARLDALPVDERIALQQASVVGYVFWDQAVSAIHPPSTTALPELMRRELVFGRETTAVDEASEFVFKHHVLQQVTYASILKRDRREYHQRTADWLAGKSGARVGEYLGLIADHYERSGDTRQAREYLHRAGRDAARRYANDAALHYLNRALALAPDDDLETRFSLLMDREAVYELQGARTEQLADLEVLDALAERLGDPLHRAELAERRSIYFGRTGAYAETIASGPRFIALAQAAGLTRAALRAEYDLGWALMRVGRHADAQTCAEANIAAARAAGDRGAEAMAFTLLGALQDEQGDIEGAKSHERSLRLHEAAGDPRLQAVDCFNIGETSRLFGDYEGARRWSERGLHLAREIGSRPMEGVTLLGVGAALFGLRDCEGAVAHARQAIQVLQASQDREFEAYAQLMLGDAQNAMGLRDDAADSYRAALALSRQLGLADMATAPEAALAQVALANGDAAAAMRHVQAILDHVADGGGLERAELLRIHYTCYRVLDAASDARADAQLETAQTLLAERAAKISDPDARRLYENIPLHRDIAMARSMRAGATPPPDKKNPQAPLAGFTGCLSQED